ncbi:MAG: hypothetical protein E7666_04990 [Ruminococcaceae bacterium]|nr:hypothetical protein [Oscillospiraceae bacterium]
MSSDARTLGVLIGSIRVPIDATNEDILKKAREKMKRAGLTTSSLHFRLFKKSVDARRRNDLRFECTVLAEGVTDRRAYPAHLLARADARLYENETLSFQHGTDHLSARPLVVGMGPAGLFAALLLAREGYAPILIDRGASVRERVRNVEQFRTEGVLDPESNIQFGAGGAGTFSDGKLVTRIHDPRTAFVMQTLHAFGAPEEVLYHAKPHVGTDLLRGVVEAMLAEIERLGGTLHYRCKMEDFSEQADGTLQIKTNQGSFCCGALILAPGHSSRDTYLCLLEKNFVLEPKPISIGFRAEHLQEKIDAALYGRFAGHPNLGHAEYALSDTRGERGVYTFCMCPGGEVVAAASESGGLVVNGMSNHARDGKNANAAVLASVEPADMEAVNGSIVLGAIEFQRLIERAAFRTGGGDYYAPIMTAGDFLNGSYGREPGRVLPSYRGGKVRVSNFENIYPDFLIRALRYALTSFGKKLEGYDAPDTVLTAAETRTSAPLRILRDGEQLYAIGHSRIYPCGEGAGYAGGITSAAVDGVRVASALMARFAPPKSEQKGI